MFRSPSTVWCGVVLLISVATATGRELDGRWIRGVYTGESPWPLPRAEEQAWREASELAEKTPGAFVLVGSGRSMRPLYDAGTILVLKSLPYGELQRGQTVLYRNQENKVVAHVLVTKTRDGWRAQGLNNPYHDMEPVQPGNLVGIVVAAFKPVASLRTAQFVTVQ